MTEPPILYGVWIPGQGWLKTHAGAVAFVHRTVAESTAKRIGSRARSEYIDDSLKDLEQTLLQAEVERRNRSLWTRIKLLLDSSKKNTQN
jgi:hypothetical protein